MPDPKTKELLRDLMLSASDLKVLSDWPDALIEDYLNIVDNLIIISDLLDIEIDQKIEEIETDFTDDSIPFVDDNLLIEDNTNLFWNNVAKVLNTKGLIVTNAPVGATDVLRLTDVGVLVGNVIGPGASTDEAIARFDGVAGKVLQNSLVTIDDAGNVGINEASPTISDGVGLHLDGKIIRIEDPKTPASALAAGNVGEFCWDANFFYICIAANSWQRVAHAAW